MNLGLTLIQPKCLSYSLASHPFALIHPLPFIMYIHHLVQPTTQQLIHEYCN